MSKTQEEIEELKRQWKYDPCWDIEKTEGFEEYADELKAYREQCEKQWAHDYHMQVHEYATKIGLSNNPVLAEYIMKLERRVCELEARQV